MDGCPYHRRRHTLLLDGVRWLPSAARLTFRCIYKVLVYIGSFLRDSVCGSPYIFSLTLLLRELSLATLWRFLRHILLLSLHNSRGIRALDHIYEASARPAIAVHSYIDVI